MTTQFNTYAKFYDLLYKDKDYKGESRFIDELISRFVKLKKDDIALLDLACGTGKHLFELHDLGYRHLAGSDIASQMIDLAKSGATSRNTEIDFYNYSFQEADQIARNFNVVLSMFSAVNYLVSYDDQAKTFQNVNKLLNENGLFIFDYWNGNAVARDYSPVKVLRKNDENAEILRISETNISLVEQHVSVKFTCLYFESGQKLDEFTETHDLHYYYFSEMKNLLAESGFVIEHCCPFMKSSEEISPFDWNVSIVARKVKNL